MKAHLLIFAAVLLVPCWMMPAGQWKAPSSIPLNMVPDAVDDMYNGCTEKMERRVKKEYFRKEFVGTFKIAWENAEKCSNKYSQDLTKNQRQAICVYTSNDIYAEFNKAVRTSRSIYGSSFRFHSLHFWLTTAIQKLNNKHCYISYRRSRAAFTGNVNSIIRFGAFASSSLRTDLKQFGSKTCFQIMTCFGAYVKHHSNYPNEEEVLIPPYERFKITKIINGRGKFPDLSDCEKVFTLRSSVYKSNLNCKAAPRLESSIFSK
ncbi:erythroblast NAD(P)(+)--arginine ADP-ribosyltransferase-like [Thunnus maccoyii]|uniref:erythroblast NAD(P)(+)--arginine ADP-ribosyltransferase-like n=1 Tax=Thunnus maccoyii TaxID=8240 RepID=UPI001C4C273F|nr:erythroblast NAD(P)(+)--arginine ADP-ribosyltransferase-like [Thunnus maccoyii]